MKSLLLLLSFMFSCILVHAQTYEWVQRTGNIKSDKITSVKTDGLGHLYIAGYFSNTISIGTNALVLNNIANQTSKEAFVAKLDSNGVCLWARAGGQHFDDRVLGMDVDSIGNVVITGTYWEGSGINFPPINITGSGSGSGDQCFIMKYDPNGAPLWGKFVCGNSYGDDQGLDVVMDKVGNIYTVGFMSNDNLICQGSSVTATNPNTGSHKHCYWITKMNSAGVFQWARTFGNLPWDPDAFKYVERDIAVCMDQNDGIYITGGFDGSNRQFGTSSFSSLGGHDIFVMKYDTNGNYQWATHGGSDKDDWSNGICSDKNGNIYVTGEHRDSLIMDTVLVKNYDKRDAFLFRMDAQTGKPIWGKRAGSNLGSERGNDVWADANCNVYVCGDINDGAKFGDNLVLPVTGLGVQGFVARITPEGKWTWVATGGGPGDDDRANAIAKGKHKQLYVGGFFRASASYGTTALTSAGSSDAFFMRLTDSMLNRGTPFVLTPPVKQVLCFGDTAHLEVPKHAYFQINPSTGVSFNSDSTKLVFAPNVTTSYSMSGYTAGLCGEADTASFTIQVGLESFSLTRPADSAICPGEKIDLAILPHDNFQIQPGTGATVNSDESMVTFAPTSTTLYTITGNILGPCPTYDTIWLKITANPNPVAAFSVTPDVTYFEQPVFTLSNTTTGASSYAWYGADNSLFSTLTNPVVTEDSVGTYCYTLVAESTAGCVDTAHDCGDIINNEKVFFPTAFTPNGDGRNDEFKPVLVNIDLSRVKGYNLVIVNRFGEPMFKTFNPADGWNGNLKGSKCDLGTYFYVCEFETPQGNKHNVKGDVTLVR
ncbi:MAG: T9SS type B sorting domain-containing protein [Sphingobacteriales bacterium]|nr:MAG: T9SS type B sorting domain-containing protein [Sphingobacteriales bacterium]